MLRKKVKEKELFIIQLLEKISFLECEVRHYIIVIVFWNPKNWIWCHLMLLKCMFTSYICCSSVNKSLLKLNTCHKMNVCNIKSGYFHYRDKVCVVSQLPGAEREVGSSKQQEITRRMGIRQPGVLVVMRSTVFPHLCSRWWLYLPNEWE